MIFYTCDECGSMRIGLRSTGWLFCENCGADGFNGSTFTERKQVRQPSR